MFIQHIHQGAVRLDLYAHELALFALAFREASSSNDLTLLNPIMGSTLNSFAAVFETTALLAMQQTGMLKLKGNEAWNSERIRTVLEQIVKQEGDAEVPEMPVEGGE